MNVTPYMYMVCLMSTLIMMGCKPRTERTEQASTAMTPGSSSAVQGLSALTLKAWGGGASVELGQYAEKDTLLVFFAPWSDSGSAVTRWLADLSVSGVEILPIVVDRRGGGEIGEGSDSLVRLGKPVFVADEVLLASLGGIRALPTAVWLKPGTTVAGSWAGFPSFTGIVATVSGSARTAPSP